MSPLRHPAVRAILGIAISAGLLTWILSRVEYSAVVAQLHQARPGWFAIAFGLSAVVLAARIARFALLVERASWRDVASAIAFGNFLNRVMPLRLGELGTPYLLHKLAGEDLARSLVRLVLVRLVEIWVMLAIVAGAAGFWFGTGGTAKLWLILGLLALTGALIAFKPLLVAGVRLGRWLAGRLGLLRFAAVARVLDKLEKAAADGARLNRREALAVGLGGLAVMLLQAGLFWALITACGVAVHPAQVLVGSSAAHVAGALPVLSVGSFGTHETGWTAGFTWVGMALTPAILTGVVTQVVTLCFSGLFALPAWWWTSRKAP